MSGISPAAGGEDPGSALSFHCRIHRPAGPAGLTLVLLHGSGADETSLVPLAREIAPDALLLAVRGRVVQDGGPRWFARVTPTRFVQESIRAEAAAFAGFARSAAGALRFDLSRAVFLGYSNGANLVTSVMLLNPDVITRAVLLRAIPVLDHVPGTDLSAARILAISGTADVTYAPFASTLVELLRRHGAEVEDRVVPAGHEFGADDAALARDWLMKLQRRH
ncbi:hypothetical protein MesoLjLc_29860 [Mesorhizobium sp. L-8-10]|uniref:alpha/beta hydrolase n=1 Tax=Mesorhizobium sp. L-8-10 TaxID=2744523 RepID=UPI0019260028|nr:alpha/beta hydrolase [Mesorhizobium sp. L-8-10]BCH31056.1 hypothetical protein MesoLjLc_29860 [Mesorhizobium sp. L-8-10]